MRGFVSSANQHSTDTTYPYQYHGYFDDYRGRTLNEKLAQLHGSTVDEMKELQNSTYSKLANDLCPLLLNLMPESSQKNPYIEVLKDWDYYYRKEAKEPIIFEIWRKKFTDLLWDEFSAIEKKEKIDVLYPEIWRTISLISENPDDTFFDIIETAPRENAVDLAWSSFNYASGICDSLFAENPTLVWKEYRPVKINHLSRVPAFSEIGIDVGGVASALNSIKGTHGPSWRMVVKLSEPVQAWGVYPGGQSGNPGSPFYKNMISTWAKGKYFDLIHPDQASQMYDHSIGILNLSP